MRESSVESYLKAEAAKIGGKSKKFVSPGSRGEPDQIVLMPGGRIWFVELKAPGKTERPQQAKRHKELRALGFTVLVLSTKPEIDEFIKKEVIANEVQPASIPGTCYGSHYK